MEFLTRREGGSPHPEDFPILYRQHLKKPLNPQQRTSSPTIEDVQKIFAKSIQSPPPVTLRKQIKATPAAPTSDIKDEDKGKNPRLSISALKEPEKGAAAVTHAKPNSRSLVNSLKQRVADARHLEDQA